MKKALITGITGQDGSYLSEYLLEKGYDVYGLVRRTSAGVPDIVENLEHLGKVTLVDGNLRDLSTVRAALEKVQPDEIYNLAAQSHVGVSFNVPDETWDINYYGVGRVVIEATRLNPAVKIYQASTSEMFGETPPPQNEESPLKPVSPYSESKTRAHEDFIKGYRERRGVYACSGILFNHESPRRGKQFVTRKITLGLAGIQLRSPLPLRLGNLNAERDWGYAGDYVKAMHLMLQQPKADDYVVATGVAHSVRDFVNAAAMALGMHIVWEGEGLSEVGKDAATGKTLIEVDEKFYRPREVNHLLGDASKARRVLGWKPEVSFEELVAMMTKADYDILSRKGSDSLAGV